MNTRLEKTNTVFMLDNSPETIASSHALSNHFGQGKGINVDFSKRNCKKNNCFQHYNSNQFIFVAGAKSNTMGDYDAEGFCQNFDDQYRKSIKNVNDTIKIYLLVCEATVTKAEEKNFAQQIAESLDKKGYKNLSVHAITSPLATNKTHMVLKVMTQDNMIDSLSYPGEVKVLLFSELSYKLYQLLNSTNTLQEKIDLVSNNQSLRAEACSLAGRIDPKIDTNEVNATLLYCAKMALEQRETFYSSVIQGDVLKELETPPYTFKKGLNTPKKSYIPGLAFFYRKCLLELSSVAKEKERHLFLHDLIALILKLDVIDEVKLSQLKQAPERYASLPKVNIKHSPSYHLLCWISQQAQSLLNELEIEKRERKKVEERLINKPDTELNQHKQKEQKQIDTQGTKDHTKLESKEPIVKKKKEDERQEEKFAVINPSANQNVELLQKPLAEKQESCINDVTQKQCSESQKQFVNQHFELTTLKFESLTDQNINATPNQRPEKRDQLFNEKTLETNQREWEKPTQQQDQNGEEKLNRGSNTSNHLGNEKPVETNQQEFETPAQKQDQNDEDKQNQESNTSSHLENGKTLETHSHECGKPIQEHDQNDENKQNQVAEDHEKFNNQNRDETKTRESNQQDQDVEKMQKQEVEGQTKSANQNPEEALEKDIDIPAQLIHQEVDATQNQTCYKESITIESREKDPIQDLEIQNNNAQIDSAVEQKQQSRQSTPVLILKEQEKRTQFDSSIADQSNSVIQPSVQSEFLSFYNLLNDAIRVLTAKENDLEHIKNHFSLTRVDTQEKLRIITLHLNHLKDFRKKIGQEVLLKTSHKLELEEISIDFNSLKIDQYANFIAKEAAKSKDLQFVRNKYVEFQSHTITFYNTFENYLNNKKQTGGIRFWMGRFRENFVDAVRKAFKINSSPLTPTLNLSSIGICHQLYRVVNHQLFLFNKQHIPKNIEDNLKEVKKSKRSICF